MIRLALAMSLSVSAAIAQGIDENAPAISAEDGVFSVVLDGRALEDGGGSQ